MAQMNHFLAASALLLLMGCADDPSSDSDDSAETADPGDAGAENQTGESSDDDSDDDDSEESTDDDDSTDDEESNTDDDSDDDDEEPDTDDDDSTDGEDDDDDSTDGADDSTDDEEPNTDEDDSTDDEEPNTDDDSDDDVTTDDESNTDDDTIDDSDDIATDDDSDDIAIDDDSDDIATDDDVTTDEGTSGDPETFVSKNAIFQFTQQHFQVPLSTQVISGGAFAAYFFETEIEVVPVEEVEDPCTETRVGACVVRVCPEAEPVEEPEYTPIFRTTELQPESVTITGLLVDPIETEFVSIWEQNGLEVPEGDNILTGYNAQFVENILWWTDDEAHIIVEPSADVPAFDVSFAMPNVPELTSPSSISTSDALELTWTNPGAGEVYIGLTGQDGGGNARRVDCQLPSADAGVSVAASLLDGMQGAGYLTISTLLSTTGQQGDWYYSVAAQDSGLLRQVTYSD